LACGGSDVRGKVQGVEEKDDGEGVVGVGGGVGRCTEGDDLPGLAVVEQPKVGALEAGDGVA
jgi:hypothetical protein